ncbi:hypothetical protein FIBSPDRAFT_934836 [Athelia psychrophila]|uniref:Uncharacterized protein n=1 Tax=Athelia psychrophila TaxID=1759441 RepID=A0A166EUM8_9AGAM|nr:hypothetical protein FIBSPDRAFT_934836 [Fibularhizoctonia sp. CBS 109695]
MTTRQSSLASDISAAIAALETKVDELEAQEFRLAPELKACRESLKSTRASLASLAKFQRNSRAPVLLLPPEILGYIFEIVVNGRTRPFQHLPMLLSGICRVWREVSISNPHLWTNIRVGTDKPKALSDLYFQRSKACDLNVYYVHEAPIPGTFKPASLNLHRCRRLFMKFNYPATAECILRIMTAEAAPRLRGFQVSLDDSAGGTSGLFDDGAIQPLFNGDAPALRTFTMSGMRPLKSRTLLGTITHLELKTSHVEDELSPEDFALFLRGAARSLKYMVLEGIVVGFRLGEKPSKIELPTLISLNIRYPTWGDDADYIADIWSCISTPVLGDLTLHNLNDAELHETMNAVNEQRGGGAFAEVKVLCLDNTYMEHYAAPDYEPQDFYTANNMVDDLMLAFPEVTILLLKGDAVLSVLTLMLETDRKNTSSDTGTLWPHLQCLMVERPREQLIRDIVLSRKAVGHPISELKIQLEDELPAKSVQWLRRRVPNFSIIEYSLSRAGLFEQMLFE